MKIRRSEVVDWLKFEKEVAALQKDFPSEAAGYDPSLSLINHYQPVDPAKARQLAEALIQSPAPEAFRVRAQGVLNRMSLLGKPVQMRFTALDGSEVDLAKLTGKVVLIDFWATWCRPCIVDLPKVKAAYEKFHAAGFEIIGVSCDENQQALDRFLKRQEITWPQYFDGQRQAGNRLAREFGIIGVPHMLLLDRNGHLRFDNVKAGAAEFQIRIQELLREK